MAKKSKPAAAVPAAISNCETPDLAKRVQALEDWARQVKENSPNLPALPAT